MKKTLITLIIVAIIAVAGALYWFLLKGMFKDYPTNAKAIPEDAFVVFKGGNLRNTYESFLASPLASGIKDHPKIDTFNQRYSYLDSLLDKSDMLRNMLNDKPLLISLHNVSVDQISLLGILQTKSLNANKQFREAIKDFCPTCRFSERTLRNFPITDVVRKKAGEEKLFTYSTMEGILTISANAVLVEDAVRQFALTEEANLPKFHKAIASTGNNDRLYVNFEQLPAFLGTFTHYKSSEFLSKNGILPGFASYEIQFKKGSLQLHGTYKPLHKRALLQGIQQVSPEKSEIPKVLPFRTAFFQAFQIPDPQDYYDSLAYYYEQKEQKLQFKHYRDSLENQSNFSIREDFLPILGDELALVVNEPVSTNFQQNTFVAMHTKETKATKSAIQSLQTQLSADSQTDKTTIQYRGKAIESLPIGSLFPFLFGDFFKTIQSPFYAQLGDFILFASSPKTLKRVIDDYKAGQTLAASSHYTRLKSHLLSETNLFFYLNPDRAIMLPLNYLREALKKDYRKDFDYYKKFGAVAFQLVSGNDNDFSQLTIQKASQTEDDTRKLWEEKISDNIKARPQIVINHENKEKEIFLTDSSNNLYLMNNSGSIRWSRDFDEPIMGEAEQVDLYKNDNLQYVFATQNHLQLLDRKGRDVASFPISLSAPATTGLAAFDYNDNKNYRYFISCRNNNAYGYYAAGNPLEGWSPQSLDAPLDHPVKYFKRKGQTKLYGVSRKGTFYLWKQDGQVKFKKQFQTRFNNNFEMYFGDSDSTTYMAAPDTAGITHFVYANGDTLTKSFSNFKGKQFFDLRDFNQDNRKEFIFAKGSSIKAFHRDSTKAFSLTLADTLSYAPQFHNINGRAYIGYVSRSNNQIFLVDLDGSLYPGFPLKGSTPFRINDINKDGELELMVGDKNGKIFLYKLE